MRKRDRLLASKNARISELETNGCALISLLLSNDVRVLYRYKQVFEYVDNSPARPSGGAAGTSSDHRTASDDAVYPHPLNSDIKVPRSKLRWPLDFLVGGSRYGAIPPPELLLPENLATSSTSDARRLITLQ